MLLKHREKLLSEKNNDGGTPLLVAGSCGNFEVVCFLCDEYGDADKLEINARDSEGETILHKVCDGNVARVIKWLLEQNADVVGNDAQRNPLHMACYVGHAKSAITLLDGLARDQAMQFINAEDKWGDKPLGDAVDRGHNDLALELLKHSAYFSRSSIDPIPPELYLSGPEESETVTKVLRNWLETTKKTLKNDSGDTSKANEHGVSPKTESLHGYLKAACYWAISNGNLELVEACLALAKDTGADFNLPDGEKTWHDTFSAGFSHSESWVNSNTWERFREPNNLRPPENVGKILLHLAVENAKFKVVEKVLAWPKLDATPSALDMIIQRIPDGEGKDVALISLAVSGSTEEHYDIHRLLWNKIKDEAGRMKIFSGHSRQLEHSPESPFAVILELAAQFGEETTLKDFLQTIWGAKINNDNALGLAIRLQYPRVVYWLLSNGGYLDDKNIQNGLDILAKLKQDLRPESYESIKRILEAPPDLTKHGRRSDDHMPPLLELQAKEVERIPNATIVDFTSSKEGKYVISRLQRRPMTEILADNGIQKAMNSGVTYDSLFLKEGVVELPKGTPGEAQPSGRMQRGKVKEYYLYVKLHMLKGSRALRTRPVNKFQKCSQRRTKRRKSLTKRNRRSRTMK
ncbi:uncharacterized protein N7506_003762 [Penicillium brevicompactum]|uniref:uncharacterized protein n=1 Tax=Penicillium brevicompactum TaxID=5074 RepID=UPI0025412F7D|nr:uncharacterized protein N7506_003762 [Penicillium brevicompactum]KAJ5343938.1 hypothetical protein N7506_003762 [Penicillium brevicompactum]